MACGFKREEKRRENGTEKKNGNEEGRRDDNTEEERTEEESRDEEMKDLNNHSSPLLFSFLHFSFEYYRCFRFSDTMSFTA